MLVGISPSRVSARLFLEDVLYGVHKWCQDVMDIIIWLMLSRQQIVSFLARLPLYHCRGIARPREDASGDLVGLCHQPLRLSYAKQTNVNNLRKTVWAVLCRSRPSLHL